MGLPDFFRGYIVFEAVGGFGERFLNLCRYRNVDIKNVKVGIGKITAELNLKEKEKLKDIAENSGVTINIIEKKGLPFAAKRRSHRIGLAVGVPAVLMLMLIMNCFVWCIDAEGSERYSPEQLIEAAEKTGLHYGVFVPAFDEVASARDIITSFGGTLQWGAVNIKGSRAVIEVRDFVDELEPFSGTDPCNIVATADGVIMSLEAQRGVAAVIKGSAVSKGDVLISGAVDKQDMSAYFTHAKGSVTALTQRSLTVESESKKQLQYTELHSFYSLNLLFLRIPLGFYKTDKASHTFTEESYIKMGKVRLPFSVTKTTIAKLSEKEDVGESFIETLAGFSEKEYTELANTLILSKELAFKSKKGSITLSCDYSCIDFIGKEQPIIIEND